MFCPKCAAPNLDNAAFCRSCGQQFREEADPTRLTGLGIAKFMIGDAFVIPAVLLAAIDGPVQSVLWLLMMIPGLILFALGVSDIVRARAITNQREASKREVTSAATSKELGVPASVEFDFENARVPASVTDPTTGRLR